MPSYQEPFLVTVSRTGVLALVLGAVATRWMSGLAHWPMATLLALWPSFGGHWVELWFLNYLRPRLPAARALQALTRVVVWFIGGACLFLGMRLTAMTLAQIRPAHWPNWWLGGAAFIGVELVVHLVMQLRGRPSFYNGRG